MSKSYRNDDSSIANAIFHEAIIDLVPDNYDCYDLTHIVMQEFEENRSYWARRAEMKSYDVNWANVPSWIEVAVEKLLMEDVDWKYDNIRDNGRF